MASLPLSNVRPIASDLVSDFLALTEADNNPEIFRKWAAISLVAGALERRVWATVGAQGGKPRLTYPNLYVFLVAAPAIGKFVIEIVQGLWAEVTEPGYGQKGAFHVAPSNMTKASMVDRLAKSTWTRLGTSGPPIEHHSLLVAAEEFGVFMPAYDLEFIGVLNKLYNCPEVYSEERRHGPSREISISHPCLNLLGGVQPGWLASVFPEEAWAMGLTSRVIMVYASAGEPADPFAEGADLQLERSRLVANLGRLSGLFGEVGWSAGAIEAIRRWHMAGGPPTPTHSKLEHYVRRRTLHAIKLSIVSAVSRTHRLGPIDAIDVDRAIAWLTEAEALMPDAFRAMIGKSDHAVTEELYAHLVSLWNLAKQTPVHESRLILFLKQRMPSDKVLRILDIAERSNMLARVAGTSTYIPRPRGDFGVE